MGLHPKQSLQGSNRRNGVEANIQLVCLACAFSSSFTLDPSVLSSLSLQLEEDTIVRFLEMKDLTAEQVVIVLGIITTLIQQRRDVFIVTLNRAMHRGHGP